MPRGRDNFNQPDAALPGPYLTWQNVSGTFGTLSQQANGQTVADTADTSCRSTFDVGNIEMEATVVVAALTRTSQPVAGVAVRFASGANTHYSFMATKSATNPNGAYQTIKTVAGTESALVTETAYTFGANDALTLRATGTTNAVLQGFINGKQMFLVTDSSSPIITGTMGGMVGWRAVAGDTFAISSYDVTDLGYVAVQPVSPLPFGPAASPPPPPFVDLTNTVFSQVLSAVSTGTATFGGMVVNKIVSATSTGTPSIVKLVSKAMSATSTGTATIVKLVNKALTATSTGTASMSRALRWAKVLSVTSTGTASMVRQINKVLSVTSTATASLTKLVSKALSVTSTGVATLAAQVPHVTQVVMNATCTATATFSKVIYKRMVVAAKKAAAIFVFDDGEPR